MIDNKLIGRKLPRSVLSVEPGRLRFFAKAIGETNPVYFDLAVARAAGYPDLPAPPTFIFAAELDAGAMAKCLTEMGVNLGRVLHGEQAFTYHEPVHAGDTITVETRISDIYDKRGGALEFIVMDSGATNQHGRPVAEMRSVLIVRH